MVIMGPPLTLISIVKPKRGVGSHVEKGWDPPGPTASHRARFGSHVEKSWDPPGPTEPDLGPTVEKSSDPPGPTNKQGTINSVLPLRIAIALPPAPRYNLQRSFLQA